MRSARCELWPESSSAAIGRDENDRAAFVGGALDLVTGLGGIGVDERRPLWIRRASPQGKVMASSITLAAGERLLSVLIAFPIRARSLPRPDCGDRLAQGVAGVVVGHPVQAAAGP